MSAMEPVEHDGRACPEEAGGVGDRLGGDVGGGICPDALNQHAGHDQVLARFLEFIGIESSMFALLQRTDQTPHDTLGSRATRFHLRR